MNAAFVVRRLAQVPVAMATVLLITFCLIQFIPGDPAYAIAGPDAGPSQVERARHDFGLDRPLPAQFLKYAHRVVRGDLGESYVQGRPVSNIIRDYAPPTLLLTGTALFVSTVFGIFFAVTAVRRPFGLIDKVINSSMLVAYAVPGFWIAQLAILYMVLKFHLFPLEGYAEFGIGAPTGIAHLADVGRHLMLPALVLAVTEVAAVTRVLRSGLLGQLEQGYVRTAEAKGLTRKAAMQDHALRNALLPMVALIGARVGFLLSGAAVIETIFSWPGLGSLLLTAIESRDRPLMLGMVLVASFAIIFANFLTDVVYRLVDPRIQYE